MSPYTRFFTAANGARIAYATLGDGPPLIYLPALLSHIELQREAPAIRAFDEALAADFSLVRYDRYGCGLSDRDRTDFSLDVDVRVLADLVDHLRLRRVALLGASAGGPVAVRYAAAAPRRVSHLLIFGTTWQPRTINPVRGLVHQLLQAEPRLGASAFAQYLIPGGDPDALAWFARIYQEAADPETTVKLSEAAVSVDLAAELPRLRVPTLVMHRRGDRIASFEGARELAARIPGAHFASLDGDDHIAEFGDAAAVVRAIRAFVGAPGRRRRPAPAAPEEPAPAPLGLSERETEVLDLIAAGLSNREIAERLSISVHTIERHAANLYAKLGVRGRAEATAYALRRRATATIPDAT
jgi:pimeloyl-ACP methyl ester carboxylesterase/DNA-binding CsgD family transcriptional regulator